MHRAALITILTAACMLLACGKPEEAAPLPAQSAPAQAPATPAPPQEVGESCSQDCGGGTVAAIRCAAGETPVCDCAKQPNASCVPAPPAAR